jgi:ATP synthase F1 gamma subunit
MAKGRQLKGRIRSVQNTRKITRTMELVSTSKLKRAQDRVVAARPYAEALREVIADLVTPDLAERFPLLRRPATPAKGGPTRAAVILLTSNRGLAGAFNSNLIKEARRRVEELERAGYTVELHGIGKKGIGFFKYLRRKLALERIDIGDKPTADHAAEIAQPLIDAYSAGALASVDLVHAKFVSALTTPPTTTRILPVETGGPADRRTGRESGALAGLHPGAERGCDPGAAAAALRPQHGLSRTGGNGRGGARRTADRDEERDRQRRRDPGGAQAHLQSPAAGGHHPGDRGDRGRRGGAAGVGGKAVGR